MIRAYKGTKMTENKYYTLQEAIEWIAFRKESDNITADILNRNDDRLASAEQALLKAIKSHKIKIRGQFDSRSRYSEYTSFMHPEHNQLPLEEERPINDISDCLNIYPESNKVIIDGHYVYRNIKIDIEILKAQFPQKPINNFPLVENYTTPYLEIMAEVIQEAGLTTDNQSKKDVLKLMINKKFTEYGLEQSDNLADAMATLIRTPNSQKGRWK